MALNSLRVVTALKPSLGYKLCAEIAREGYETGKSLHIAAVRDRELLTQERWDTDFSGENLFNPELEKVETLSAIALKRNKEDYPIRS